MLFSSLIFIGCFLPAVLFIYYVLLRRSRKFQNYFLLIASLGFYAFGEPLFVFVMIGSIVGNWFFGLLMEKYRRDRHLSKTIIVLMLVFNLSILFVFKYLAFTIANINILFGDHLTVPHILLPIGISFFTFQAISYVMDIYRGKAAVQTNLPNVGLYIALFPALIAGPIVRYETIEDQIMNRKETFDGFSEGVCRFITGLGKKVLLANNFAVIADQSFALSQVHEASVSFAWLGAVAYTLQIYFDFSGYSDMAIGLGKMFGFKLPENFNYPYIAKSASEFWRRWHISLGTWFRDYVYFSLGGSRVDSKFRLLFNLFIVWALTGFWHGANWTFVCWGLLYFVFISLEKLTNFDKRGLPVLKHVYTMLLVVIGWVLFRAATISDAAYYLKTMFGMSGAPFMDANTIVYWQENIVFFIFGILFTMPVAKIISNRMEKSGKGSILIACLYALTFMVIFMVALSYLVKGAYNPFIYFNF